MPPSKASSISFLSAHTLTYLYLLLLHAPPPTSPPCCHHPTFSITPVATRAQFWANQLATNATVYGSAPCNLVHGDTDGVGQNIAMYGGGADTHVPMDGINLWVNEGKDYDYALFNPFSSDPAIAASGCRTGSWANCGHFTQVRRGHCRGSPVTSHAASHVTALFLVLWALLFPVDVKDLLLIMLCELCAVMARMFPTIEPRAILVMSRCPSVPFHHHVSSTLLFLTCAIPHTWSNSSGGCLLHPLLGQLIWKDTTAIGCYQIYCSSNSRTLWVCDYSPPGNWGGAYPY